MSFKQIQATQQIMRIAINGQNHVDSLIGYYRDMIDKFNDQRAQWVIYYQACKQNVSNKHLLERQINNHYNKKIDLEQQLSGLKGQLTYQRQKYFQRVQNNQKIKENLQQNKKRLQQLTQICKPLTLENSRLKSATSLKTKAYDSGNKGNNTKLQNKQNQRNARQQLELQLINISRQHDQKKQKLQKIIDKLKDQLQELVSEHSSRGNQCSQQYQQILNKLSDLQSKNMNLVSQFFRFRMENVQQQQKIQQQNQIIRLKNMALVQKLKQLQQYHSTEFKTIDDDQQLRKKQQHLSILKQQHQRISDIYLNKLKKLSNQLKQTTQKTRTIQQKTKVQVSSLKSQIKILTNRLENVGINQMRNDIQNGEQQSEDDSSVTLEMEELERINKQVKDLEKQLDKKN